MVFELFYTDLESILEAVNQLKNLEGSINICQFKVFCDRSRPFLLAHLLFWNSFNSRRRT